MSAHTVPLDRDLLQSATAPLAHPVRRVQLAPAPSAQPRKRGIGPLAGALTAVTVILVTLFAQLGLSIAVSEGAYEARALQLELKDLNRVERVLTQNATKLASPQNLAANAAELGMVQNTTPATIRLSDAAVLGQLGGETTAVSASSVPNATLVGLPLVDANGLLVDRNPQQAEAVTAAQANAPIAWEGALPAPHTH